MTSAQIEESKKKKKNSTAMSHPQFYCARNMQSSAASLLSDVNPAH